MATYGTYTSLFQVDRVFIGDFTIAQDCLKSRPQDASSPSQPSLAIVGKQEISAGEAQNHPDCGSSQMVLEIDKVCKFRLFFVLSHAHVCDHLYDAEQEKKNIVTTAV